MRISIAAAACAAVLAMSLTAAAQTPASGAWASGTYRYDPSGNITDIGSDAYVYDTLGRLKTATIDSAGHAFDYDGFGNIRTISDGSRTLRLGVHSASNRMDQSTVQGVASDIHAQYDTAGNVHTIGVDTFVPDVDGPHKESTVMGQRVLYIYSPSDERVGSIAVDAAGAEMYSNWTLRDGGGAVLSRYQRFNGTWAWEQDYVYANGQMLVAEVQGREQTLHYYVDHLGTPRLITGNGGVEIARHKYAPFGAELTSALQDTERKKFTGHERDEPTLDYMHARYYNPVVGRFLSPDPGRDWSDSRPQSWNLYTYVTNSPIGSHDPDGQAAEKLEKIARTSESIAGFIEEDPRMLPARAAGPVPQVVAMGLRTVAEVARFGDATATAVVENKGAAAVTKAVLKDGWTAATVIATAFGAGGAIRSTTTAVGNMKFVKAANASGVRTMLRTISPGKWATLSETRKMVESFRFGAGTAARLHRIVTAPGGKYTTAELAGIGSVRTAQSAMAAHAVIKQLE